MKTQFPKVTLTLTVPVTLFVEDEGTIPSLVDLQEAIRKEMSNYSDGRYPFAVEQLNSALCSVVHGGIRDAVRAGARRVFGDEMEETGPNSRGSVACRHAEELLKKFDVMLVGEPLAVRIEERKEED